MTTTEQRLVSVIEADAACRTHLGVPPDTRLHPDALPQNPTLPAATYQRIGGAPVNSFDGLDVLDNGIFQIDVYALTRQAARDAADAIRDAIDASADLGGVLMDVRSDYEPDTDPRLYRIGMDLSFWHHEE